MMGIEPEKTIYDLVMTTGELDTEKLAGYVTTHPSGVDLVPAPVRPEDAELVAEERVARLLDVAKESYDAIVVDTPAFFQATTLATLDRTERLLLVCSLDIPTVKNVKLTLQTLNLLHYPKDRIHLVLNRSGGKGELKRGEVEKALDLKVSFELPNDREVGVAVNRGVPVPLSSPRCGVSKALADMASQLVSSAGGEGRRAPAARSRCGRGRRQRQAAVREAAEGGVVPCRSSRACSPPDPTTSGTTRRSPSATSRVRPPPPRARPIRSASSRPGSTTTSSRASARASSTPRATTTSSPSAWARRWPRRSRSTRRR